MRVVTSMKSEVNFDEEVEKISSGQCNTESVLKMESGGYGENPCERHAESVR